MLKKKFTLTAIATVATIAAAGTAYGQAARDYIYVVGSSTVYPFTTTVAETFGKATQYPTPKIESTGTGGGMQLFCKGVGVDHPDVTNASRRIKKTELEMCKENGVDEVIEIKVGYDGIVFANNIDQEQQAFALKELFLSLAKEVPDPQGDEKLVSNPYNKWSEINPELPDYEIEVLGPPPTSGTRDAWVELAMEKGCQEFDQIAAMKEEDKDKFETVCHSMREDGRFVEAGENDILIVRKLTANPKAFGIFGFSFLDTNRDKIQGLPLNGIEPTFENIASGDYPVSRPLFIYVKKAHVGKIPGLKEFLAEYTSPAAWGSFGYLSDKGLVPLDEKERQQVKDKVDNLKPLELSDL